jgi:hypothetical protein
VTRVRQCSSPSDSDTDGNRLRLSFAHKIHLGLLEAQPNKSSIFRTSESLEAIRFVCEATFSTPTRRSLS